MSTAYGAPSTPSSLPVSAACWCSPLQAKPTAIAMDEKRLVAKTFVDHAAGDLPVIVGCSSTHQRDRLALAAMARELGAPAMLCQAPAGLRADVLVAQMAELAQVGPSLLMLQDLDFGGPGLALSDIAQLHRCLPAFQALKIEVALPGPKYSAVLAATAAAGASLHVSGGWAAAQMMEALHRGVHAFIPTAMDRIYVEIFRRFAQGDEPGARQLHSQLAPVLAFSNQHLDISIRFFKHLRHREGLFATPNCRAGVAALDEHQMRELNINITRVLALQIGLSGPD